LLEESLADVDKGHPADFSMWQPDDDEREYYLIYFGDKASYEFPFDDVVRKFFSLNVNKNAICVCYFEKGEGQCGECKNLELPARKNLGSGQWKIVVGEKARITKDGARENYDFSVAVVPVDVVETPLDKGLPGDGGEYIVAPGGGSIDEPAGGA
jgi:hypothetical protein